MHLVFCAAFNDTMQIDVTNAFMYRCQPEEAKLVHTSMITPFSCETMMITEMMLGKFWINALYAMSMAHCMH